MLTGYILAYNGRENIACYVAGAGGLASASGLENGVVPCPGDGGKLLSIDWAYPCSENGVYPTGFTYEKATGIEKPRADAQKVITILDTRNGGSYIRVLVPDAYTEADYVEGCCAGCDPIAAVTIPAPILFWAECTLAAPTIPECVYQGDIYVPAFTGDNDTYTATAYGYKADGTAIVFAPTTSTGASVAALAADMQTNWASELGTGTFVASGQNILFTSTNGASVSFVVVQSEAP